LEFKEVDDALNALVAVNHASIPNPGTSNISPSDYEKNKEEKNM
jgi:hypothetical protein